MLQKNRCRYFSSGLLSNIDKYQTRTEKKNIQKSKATTVKHKHKVHNYFINNYFNIINLFVHMLRTLIMTKSLPKEKRDH